MLVVMLGYSLAAIALLLVIFLLPESKNASSLTGALPLSNEPVFASESESHPPRILDIYLRVFLSPAGILLLLIFIMSFGMTNFQGVIG